MANGKGSGSTENGAYNLVAAPAGTAPAKNFINPYTGAAPTFYIPNENEWYKAAYYSPDYGGARVGGYYAYATQSNTDPGNVVGSDANQANYHNGVFSVTQSVIHDSSQNYLTDVGAFTNSASFYGTFDQTGNVFQWNDLDGTAGSSRGLRGGTWGSDDPFIMSSSFSLPHDPLYGSAGFGFRLASPVATGVPEIDPNGLSAVLGLIVGGLGLLERRRYGR